MANTYQMLFELNAALGGGFTSAFSQGGQKVDELKSKLESLNSAGSAGDLIGGISTALETAGIIKGLEMVYDTLGECTDVAAQFETAMAGVKRTVGGNDNFIDSLGESFKKLSTEVPITADELAGIATTAGQLGIAQQDVEEFTTVMAKLGTTTDLTADMAATMLAQFANITGTTEYDRLGATVASLGDATATTASKVVEMAQGMAAAASQAGMSETDILAIAAAVGSLGIEAASGSTSMSTLISTLYKATETGDRLNEFAAVAGMTGSQFKQMWGEDAVGALNAFIQGLNDTERNGKSAVVILDELGIKNVRQTKAVLGLASAGDLLAGTINQANEAWAKNTALSEKAGVMYDTTEAKMTMMENSINNLKIAVGDALTPIVAGAADGLTQMIEPIAEFVEKNPQVVQALTAMVGVLGTATAAMGAFATISKLGAAAAAIFGASIPGVGIIMGVAGAIGALVLGIGALKNAYDDAHPSFDELDRQFDDLNEKAKEQSNILQLVDSYHKLNEESENLQELMNKGFSTEIHFTGTIDGVDKLKPEDFVDSTVLTLSAEQANLLAANSFLEDAVIKLTPEQAKYLGANDFLSTTTVALTPEQAAKLASADFLSDTTVKITPEQAKILQSSQFLDSTKVRLTPEQRKLLKASSFIDGTTTIKLTAEQATKLAAAGFLDGTTVELTPQQANFLAAEGFMEGTEVQLTAEAANALAAEGYFTDGTTVKLTAEKANELQSSEFMADQEIILTGKAGNQLTAADFGISDQTLIFMAKMDDPSYEAVVQKAKDLSSQMEQAKNDISSAQETLSSMQTEYSNLEAKIAGTKNKKEKTALTEQLEALGKAITDQTNNVDNLENKYKSLEAEYGIAASAAEELASHKEHLAEVTQALRDSSGGLISAMDNETEALNRQINAYEAIAQARKDTYTAQALDAIKKQSKHYVESIAAEERAVKGLEKAQEHQQKVQDFAAAGNAAEYLINELEQLTTDAQNYQGFSWLHDTNDDAAALQKRFYNLQDTINALTGQNYDFSGNGLAGMETVIANSDFEAQKLGDSWSVAIEEANKYADAVVENDKVQQEYLQNLINGVTDGTMGLDQLRDALDAAFSGYENGGEIVAGIMKQVEEGVNAAKAAAEGSGDAAQSEADKTVSAVNGIIGKMEELKSAYESAKESALKALSGRFGLFDEVNTAEGKSTNEMAANMKAQTKYWEDYNANLQAVLDKNLAPEIAEQLADGSAESAASLAVLANASEAEIAKINASFEDVQKSKDTLASTIADMETQFTEGMNKLKEELENTIEEMDKSSEAITAAQTTMQAYVDELGKYIGPAQSQAQAIADAVNSALASIMTDIEINISANTSGLTSGSSSSSSSAKGSSAKIRGRNAIGTDYASEGVHLLGEEGPELVYLNGGEKVLTAHETVNALSGSSGGSYVSINFSPQYNISGGGDAASIRAVLQEHDANLYDQVQTIMEDVMIDRMRTSYT